MRIQFETTQFAESLKAARAGKLQMWFLGRTASRSRLAERARRHVRPVERQSNLARFKSPAFDAIYRRMLDLPDGPERLSLFSKASEILVAYMPYRIHVHRIYNDFARPWITGYRQPLFREQAWQFIEVDGERRAKALA